MIPVSLYFKIFSVKPKNLKSFSFTLLFCFSGKKNSVLVSILHGFDLNCFFCSKDLYISSTNHFSFVPLSIFLDKQILCHFSVA